MTDKTEGSAPDAQPEESKEQPKAPGGTPPEEPIEALKQGFGLLWKAARGVAHEIKREAEKAGLGETLQQAGKELEHAAGQAAKALESFFGKVQPPGPRYEKDWPPRGDTGSAETDPARPKPVDADLPPDGGVDASGERRDVRIHLGDDDQPR
jgi:hypothetical protein